MECVHGIIHIECLLSAVLIFFFFFWLLGCKTANKNFLIKSSILCLPELAPQSSGLPKELAEERHTSDGRTKD